MACREEHGIKKVGKGEKGWNERGLERREGGSGGDESERKEDEREREKEG